MKKQITFILLCALVSTPLLAQTKTGPQAGPTKMAEEKKQSLERSTSEDLLKAGLNQLDNKDYQGAIKSFNDAYNANKPDGAFYLARMVELGIGIQADPDKARLLYMTASEKGSAKALNRVGLMAFRGEGILQDYKSARDMICKSADMGESDAEFNCAGLWQQGQGGPKDNSKAKSYYERAAQQGHIGALNALGMAARDGEFEAKDLNKAYNYFEQAAKKGNPLGLYEIGAMYEAGQPIPRDMIKAHLYYNLASARQNPQALEALQRLTNQLGSAEIERAQSLARAWKATP